MQFINTIEKSVRGIMDGAPHLAPEFRRAIARNLWWVVAVIAVLLALEAVYLIFASLSWGVNAVLWMNFGGMAASIYWFNAIFYLVLAFFAAGAVGPLRKMQAKGWKALFVLWLLFVVLEVVVLLASFSLGNLLWTILTVAFFAYAIYEPRDYFFAKPKSDAKKSTTDKDKKS